MATTYDKPTKTCPNCKGAGDVAVRRIKWTATGKVELWRDAECDECEGTGRVPIKNITVEADIPLDDD